MTRKVLYKYRSITIYSFVTIQQSELDEQSRGNNAKTSGRTPELQTQDMHANAKQEEISESDIQCILESEYQEQHNAVFLVIKNIGGGKNTFPYFIYWRRHDPERITWILIQVF